MFHRIRRRPSPAAAISGVALFVALSGSAVAAAAMPSLNSADHSPVREITVREKVKTVQFVQHGPARGEKLAMGDRVITRQALFDTNDRRIGTLVTDCVNAGATAQFFEANLQCLTTYRLRDGQIVGAGVARLADGPANRFPIIGGAGAYRSARGEITAGPPAGGYDGVDVLHLDA